MEIDGNRKVDEAPRGDAISRVTQIALFTAAQFAAALGKTPQAVRKTLHGVKPAGVRMVNGKEAATWTLASLPPPLRCSLDAEARLHRCRDAGHLLAMPPKRWEPAVPLNQIADSEITRASKLRAALMPSLLQQHDCDLPTTEFGARGIDDYAKHFGRRITAHYWHKLFNRTLWRDNAAENWSRLEIYLSDKPSPKKAPAHTLPKALRDQFQELTAFIDACRNSASPTDTEKRGIWTLAIEQYEKSISVGMKLKQAARRVRDFLFAKASFLAPTRNALRMAFERKLARWKESGQDAKSLRDGRESNGNSFEIPEEDRDLLIHRAVFYYRGDVAPAWRDLLRKGFSPEVIERYAGRAADKSHVPASVMDSIAPEVDILTVMHQGPRAFDAIKGHVTRSYDGISSLQCISGDDFTLNTYFYIPDGHGWFQLTRGQVILFIDFRSLRVLGWALEPHKSYSSLTIRSLCTHVFGEFGVPAILYFERGMWKSATLLKGKTDPFGFTEISQGLREFGVKFIHAIRPRTKAVERVGGMFQDIAEAEPGYCGRAERRDAPESLRKQMAEVEARKVHPSKYFYSLDQWDRRIGQLVDQYNAEPQQGHILAGMSPEQAFEAHIDRNNPPMQFSAGLRYLLAHDKRLARVTLNGVTIQIGKQKFNYRGQEIAHLDGREVIIWFDPENPETVVITNPDRTNPICVARSENPNALESLTDPESGTLGRELARIEGQASHMKTRFNVVKAKFPLPQRRLLAAAQAVELGQEIESHRKQFQDRQIKTQSRGDVIRRRAQKLGLRADLVENSDQNRDALNLMVEARREGETQRADSVIPQSAQENLPTEDALILSELLDAKDKPANDPIPGKSLQEENGKTVYYLKTGGSDKAKYVDDLVDQLTKFRKAGANFGQHFHGETSFGVTKKIAQSQLKCNLHDESRFDEICEHLKAKIDATILGKRNAAKGLPNYREFYEAQEAL